MTIRIAVCDDETEDLRREAELIESVLPDNMDWEIDTFSDSDDMLASDKIYQMVFLDVEMGGINGIETAGRIHQKSPRCFIYFITYHENYMDDALNKHAFRFWTKPLSKTRLIYGIQSALKEMRANRTVVTTSEKNRIEIPLRDIIYVYHSNRLTNIITARKEIKTYDTFQNITKQLDRDCFAQTHGSYYVNLNYVTEYNKTDIVCRCNDKEYTVYISKRKYAEFDKKFKKWSSELR